MPPDVRKGSAFPVSVEKGYGGCATRVEPQPRQSIRNDWREGRILPHQLEDLGAKNPPQNQYFVGEVIKRSNMKVRTLSKGLVIAVRRRQAISQPQNRPDPSG